MSVLNLVRNRQHVSQSAVPLKPSLEQPHPLCFPLQLAVVYGEQAKLPFGECYFHLGATGRQRQKTSSGLARVTWPRDSRGRGKSVGGGQRGA